MRGRLDLARPGVRSKHVVHIVFAAHLGDRSLEAVTSKDAAVRGHRLFELDELPGVTLHPPIQRFLMRWEPGDPTVYLGALWAPLAREESRRRRSGETRAIPRYRRDGWRVVLPSQGGARVS